MNRLNNTIRNSHPLVKLGLTPDETRCYRLLVINGAMNTKQVAKEMDILPSASHRLLKNLKDKGFVVEMDTYPVSYQPLPPDVAITSFSQNKLKEISKLSTMSIQNLNSKNKSSNTQIEVLTGKNDMFSKSLEMIKSAKEEILIISIGEPVSEEIRLANRDAIEKGIKIKFIAHKYDNLNKSLLESWVKMGLEVRHFAESGYHLQVVDQKKSMLTSSNPNNTEERSTVVINGKGLTNAIRNYFYNLWDKAAPINIT